MRCLWLTWQYPKPERDGQRLYSNGLIESVAGAGADVTVLCFAPDEEPAAAANGSAADWHTVERDPRPAWASVLSPLPNITFRSGTMRMQRALRRLLADERWDVIVLDGLYTGWAVPLIERDAGVSGHKPTVVYVSHNHEETTRAAVARNYHGHPAKRRLLLRDAAKAARLERQMVDRADLVTAITEDDARQYLARRPDRRVVTLPPGYQGRRVAGREIRAALPRRAVIVGSFEWLAKQMNLEEFVTVADPLFEARNAELQVIGNGSDAFLDRLNGRTRATQFMGSVPKVEPLLDEARVAIVAERTGGGFKLKVLDYVFNRLPIAALNGSVSGVPLQAPDSILTYETPGDLAHGVVSAIDDLPLLNNVQDRAYRACAGEFDWDQRGQRFIDEVAAA